MPGPGRKGWVIVSVFAGEELGPREAGLVCPGSALTNLSLYLPLSQACLPVPAAGGLLALSLFCIPQGMQRNTQTGEAGGKLEPLGLGALHTSGDLGQGKIKGTSREMPGAELDQETPNSL